MPTATLRKPARLRKAPRKAVPARRTKRAAFVLSEAEIARINGAQVSIKPLLFHPVGSLPVTKRELTIERWADAADKR